MELGSILVSHKNKFTDIKKYKKVNNNKTRNKNENMAQATNMCISRPYDGIYRLSQKHQDNEVNISYYDYGHRK